MGDDLLRDVQLTELEILKVFHGICMKHGLKYSLYGGTLLGAVRHKGFIPWDDDMDVFMERAEFERFARIWDEEHPEGYFLQTKDTEPAYTRSFAKIRKEGTTFLQGIEDPAKIHTGVFIDKMALDRLPAGAPDKARFYWAGIRYEIICREFVPSRMSWWIRAVTRAVLALNPESKRKAKSKKLTDIIRRFDDDKNLDLVLVETIKSLKIPILANVFEDLTVMPFEGEEFLCTKAWDRFLTAWFGDYMALPPESKRVWRHLPVRIDLNRASSGKSDE